VLQGALIRSLSGLLTYRKQNDIPVFCPALTDGSLGDMIYFHTYKSSFQLNIDIVSDIRRLNDVSVHSKKAGMIVLGGGVCKHQIANAMLFVSLPEGCESVLMQVEEWGGLCGVHQYRTGGKLRQVALWLNKLIRLGQYDGSDSGARPDEAVSWGKIRAGAESVKVRPWFNVNQNQLNTQRRCMRTRLLSSRL